MALGGNQFAAHELLDGSIFYDLDSNQEFGLQEDRNIFSGFYRGACNDDEISTDGYLKTSICLGEEKVARLITNLRYNTGIYPIQATRQLQVLLEVLFGDFFTKTEFSAVHWKGLLQPKG